MFITGLAQTPLRPEIGRRPVELRALLSKSIDDTVKSVQAKIQASSSMSQ